MNKLIALMKAHKKWSATLGVSLLLAGGAFAYYLGQGSGTVTGTASSTAPQVTLTGTLETNNLAPGDGSMVNITATSTVKTEIGPISGSSVTASGGEKEPECSENAGGWFTFSNPSPENYPVLVGTHPIAQGMLTFKNLPIDQSACKGATITVNLTS